MTVLKILVLLGALLVVVKFITSILGKNFPILNQLVTVILALFVTFELFKFGQALMGKFS